MTEGGVSFVIVWDAARAPGGAALRLGLVRLDLRGRLGARDIRSGP